MTHRRCIFVFTNTPPFPPLKGEAKVITADENRRCTFGLFSTATGDEYMRLPPGGGSAIGGGGACVCEIRNGVASSYSFLPHSPSVTLRAPPPSQREARIPQHLGKQTVHLRHPTAAGASPRPTMGWDKNEQTVHLRNLNAAGGGTPPLHRLGGLSDQP